MIWTLLAYWSIIPLKRMEIPGFFHIINQLSIFQDIPDKVRIRKKPPILTYLLTFTVLLTVSLR